MESVYSSLTKRALEVHDRLREQNPGARTVIALAGPPGSGKSTIAAAVARRINSESRTATTATSTATAAAVLPMDGFHYTRAHLDTLPNAAEAHARRGAHWTFDADGVVALVRSLHASRLFVVVAPGQQQQQQQQQQQHHQQQQQQQGPQRPQEPQLRTAIAAPSFDHEAKDPVQGGARVAPETDIVILEGNWLLLDREPWRRIAGLVDDTWFVDVDAGVARERVAARHVRAGIETSREAALARVDGNDLLNGDEIRTCLVKPNVVVQSVDE